MNENYKKTTEDFKWLVSLLPVSPDMKLLEPTTQAIALFSAANYDKAQIYKEDALRIALSGFIAAKARVADEDRFLSIEATTYFQVAQYLLHRDHGVVPDTEESFASFLKRIRFDKL
jgi:hypothetical protein